MSVVVAFDEVGPCRKQLRVEVPGPAVEAESRRVIGEFSRQAKVPGFRKGKVPASIVRKRFKEEIDREIVDRLVPRYWKQAEAEKSLEPLMGPQIESVDLEGDSSLVFVATVEVRPEIEVIADRDFDIPKMEVEPSDAEVEEVIARLQRDSSPWVPVDRAAGRGDQVELDLTEEPDGDEVPDAVRLEVEVGDPNVWEELSLALTGLSTGQGADFVRPAKDPEGEERRCRVEVLEVRERQLVPVDDDLARSVGEFADLEELRAGVRTRLHAERQTAERQRREEILVDNLLSRHPVTLPEGVVAQEVEEILRSYAERLAQQRVDPAHSEIHWQELREQARPMAERQVHARLVLDAIARADEIEISEEELEVALASLARLQGKSTVAVRQLLDRSGRLGAMRDRMLRNKVVRTLLGEGAQETDQQEKGLSADSIPRLATETD